MIEKIAKINGFSREDNKPIIELGSELIRCKNCKYKVETEGVEENPLDLVCSYWESDGLEATDFCSRGKRSEP